MIQSQQCFFPLTRSHWTGTFFFALFLLLNFTTLDEPYIYNFVFLKFIDIIHNSIILDYSSNSFLGAGV